MLPACALPLAACTVILPALSLPLPACAAALSVRALPLLACAAISNALTRTGLGIGPDGAGLRAAARLPALLRWNLMPRRAAGAGSLPA